MKKITQFLVLMFFFFLWYGVRAQVATYSFSHQIGTFTPNASTATRVASIEADSEVSNTLPIGFNFLYSGKNYTNFFMSSNGFISFGSVGSTLTTNGLADANPNQRPIIAPLWDDLDGKATGGSKASYQVRGTAPNRVLTIEWLNWEWYFNSTVPIISFQIKLYETTNVIEFVYRHESGGEPVSSSTSASIGINDDTGTGFLNLDTNVLNPSLSASAINDIKIRPANNQIFRFTPPSCFYIGNVTISNITQTGADIVLSTASTFPIEVYVGQSVPGITTTPTATIPAGSTTVTIPNLSPSKLHDVYIRYVCPGSTTVLPWLYKTDFYTLCGVVTGNFYEGFESTATGTTTNNTFPNCWGYVDTVTTSGYGYVTTSASRTGKNGYYAYRSATTTAAYNGDLILISPETNNLGAGTKQVRFWAKKTSASVVPVFEVYRMDGTTATSTKTILQSINLTTDWREYIVFLPNTTDDYFAFSFERNGTSPTVYIDDVYYEDSMLCKFPLNITATAITATTATISWNASLTPGVTTYDYELRAVGMPTISGTVTGTTANVTGLTPGKKYEVYVRSVCGTSKGDWTTFPIEFDTSCGVITGNFFEGFDTTDTGSSTAPTAPLCWTYVNTTGGTSAFGYVTTSATRTTGGKGFYTYRPSGTNGDILLISPQTDNLGNGTKQIRFWARKTSATVVPKFEVYRMDGNLSNSTKTLLRTINITTTDWTEYIVFLPATTDDYFAFSFDRIGTSPYVHLDDVYYEDLMPCAYPLNIAATAVTATTATISWNASLTPGVTTYDYELRAVGMPTISGTVTGTTANVTGLTPGKKYEVYVRSVCGTSKGDWTQYPIEFDTLCGVMTGNFFEGFDTTDTGTSTAPTAPLCWTYINTTGGTSAYGYVTTTATRTTGGKGFYTYRPSATNGDILLISPETDNLGNGAKQIRFWAKKTSATVVPKFEIYRMNGKTATSNKTLLQTVTLTDDWKEYIVFLPATTDDYFAFSFDRVGTSPYVYLDDVYYEDLMPCTFPLNITATAITATTATISWNASLTPGVTTYDYELRSVGMPTISGTVTGTTANVTGLTPGKKYEVYVRSICGTSKGDWTQFPGEFNTLCDVMTGNFFEGFDTTDTGTSTAPTAPLCWTYVNTTGGTSAYGYVTTTATRTTGGKGFYTYRPSTTNGDILLISPETDNLGNGTKQIRFWAKKTSATVVPKFEIYRMDGKTATSTKTLLQTINITTIDWTEYIVFLPATTDDYFAFSFDRVGTSPYVYLDDVYYEDLMPCAFPLNITATAITATTATISWNASLTPGVTTYDYELRAVGMPTISGTVTGATTANITGLTPGKDYEVFVRSVCGTTKGDWTQYPTSFTTLCGVILNDFYEGFDTTSTGGSTNVTKPHCWEVIDDVTTTGYGYVSATYSVSPKNSFYMYKTNSTANVGQNLILVSPETDNLGNGTKQLRFVVRATSTTAGTNKLEVVRANGNTATSTFTVLATYDINHTTFEEYIVILPAGTTDDYFGFRLAHNGGTALSTIYIDDVNYEKAPTCKPIDTVNLDNITKNSVEVSWIDPHNGSIPYEVEIREASDIGLPGDPGAVFNTVTAAGALKVTATGLSPEKEYKVYVRAICDPKDKGAWTIEQKFRTLCDYPDFISAPGATLCGGGVADLTANFAGGVVNWYDKENGGNLVHTGANFKTPVLTQSTSYWVQSADSLVAAPVFIGPKNPSIGSSSTWNSNAQWLNFEVLSTTTINSVDMFFNTMGQSFNIIIRDAATSTTVHTYTGSVTTIGLTNPQVVPIMATLPPGKYQMSLGTGTQATTYRNSTGAVYPYTIPGQISITGNTFDQLYYYMFYNWQIGGGGCKSPMVEVPVTVTPGHELELSVQDVVSCEGDYSSTFVDIKKGANNFDSYEWVSSSGSVIGDPINGWQLSSTVEEDFYLIGKNSTDNCNGVAKVRVSVNKKPEPNPSLPTIMDICKGEIKELEVTSSLPSQVLVGSGKVLTSKTSGQSAFVQSAKFSKQQYIYRATELFAQGVNGSGFITDLAFDISTGASTTTNSNYEIRMMLIADSSFPNTNFYKGNFSTVYSKVNHVHTNSGLQKISLDNPFYWDGQSHILVEIVQESAGGGQNAETFYTSVGGAFNSVGLYGTSNTDGDFTSGTTTSGRLNLNFYFGKTEVTWSPIVNLYTDSAARNPYSAGTKASKVYFMSNQGGSQVYKATLSAPNGCSTVVNYTFNTIDLGVPIVQDQNLCTAGSVSDIIVSGNQGGNVVFYSSPVSTNPLVNISKTGTYYVQFEKDGCTSARIPFNITILDLKAPTVQFTQVICDSGEISDLNAQGVNGSAIKWYDSLTSNVELPATHQLIDNTTYYAVQVFGNCESPRVGVLVDINPTPAALIPANNVITICGALNYGSVDLQQIAGAQLVWYSSATSQQPLNNNDLAIAGSYYVSQKVNGCESPRIAITLDVQASIPAPIVSMQNICGGGTVGQLIAQTLPNATAVWYDNANSTVPLLSTDNLVNATYYVAQKIGNCLSIKVPVAIRVVNTTAPTVTPFVLCEGATVNDLDIPLTSGVSYKWYISDNSTTELPTSYVLKSGFYFVSRMQNNCESIKTRVQITVNTRPNSPTGQSPQVFPDYAEISNIVMDQSKVIWYLTYDNAMKGINPLPQNMPLVDGETYYAILIGVNGCSSIPTPIKIGIYLGINDLDLAKLKYYPNPVDNILNISYIEEIVKVEVFDLKGRMILDRQFEDTNVSVDLSTLSSGTYMVNVKTRESNQFVKIVKK